MWLLVTLTENTNIYEKENDQNWKFCVENLKNLTYKNEKLCFKEMKRKYIEVLVNKRKKRTRKKMKKEKQEKSECEKIQNEQYKN